MTTAKNKIEKAQLAALQRRLASGKPLTAAQMAFVTRTPGDAKADGAGDSDTAGGVSALARRLGVRRQLISWHKGRSDAPKNYSVRAWRDYLLTHGKGGTISTLTAAKKPATLTLRADVRFVDGVLTAFSILDTLGDLLKPAMLAAGIEATPEQRDQVTVLLWAEIALRVDFHLKDNAPGSSMDEPPEEIAAAAKRLGVTLGSKPGR